MDASALVPLVHRRDQWHAAVVRHMRALQAAGTFELLTTNWTLYEALAVLKRAGHHRCVELSRFAEASINVCKVDVNVEREALDRFLGWSDKSASVVDHANLLIAVGQRCGALMTFDADFDGIAAGTPMRLLR